MRIPKHKFDSEALEDFDEVFFLKNSKIFLDWVQDYNWPIAKDICSLLRAYTKVLESDLIEILRSNDEEWVCTIIGAVLYYADYPSERIISVIKELYNSDEQTDYVKEYCRDYFDNFGIEYGL